MRREEMVAEIVDSVTKHYRCMGAKIQVPGNPIAAVLAEGPAVFCTGVGVQDVVNHVLRYRAAIERQDNVPK